MALTRKIWRCVALALLLTLPLAAEIAPREERDIALWIIRLGGRLMVDGIDHPIADPKDLEPLSKLSQVRELYIPARVWSPVSDVKAPFADESFQYYTGMKKL